MNRLRHQFLKVLIISVLIFSMVGMSSHVSAQGTNTYVVKPGDSLWLIAVKYKIGVTEIIEANPQIKNHNLIYPNQKVTVPNIDRVKAIEHQVIQLVNQERAKAGLKALRPNWQLSRVARHKSQNMRDHHYFSHTSPTYGSPFTMIKNYGISFKAAGENIAMGQTTAKQVMNSWMNSSGHRQNILNSNFTEIGVGYAEGGSGRYYWTQMFIRP